LSTDINGEVSESLVIQRFP